MTNKHNRRRVCIVVSEFMTVQAFLQDQIRALSAMYDVTVVANTNDGDSLRRLGLEAELVPIAISRKIDLWNDGRALKSLYSLFKDRQFDLIHSVTPKAGLLSMATGKLAGIPVRIHTFTGQVWATATGLKRYLLKSADVVTAFCATQVLADSHSQLTFLQVEGVVGADKSQVLANGSISGVDVSRFRPDAAARRRVREEISIPEDATVFLFVGRLNKDKGVLDLAKAFEKVAARIENVYLLCAGPDEGGMEARIRGTCVSCGERLRVIGQTRVPEQYMAAADALCLPSYREGFGSVVIEAAAVGLPAIASRIYGLTDAVQDGVTGCLHQPGNWEELANAMESMAGNHSLKQQWGQQARERATQHFPVRTVTEAVLDFYSKQFVSGKSAVTSFSLVAKRAFDLVGAVGAAVVMMPLLLLVAALVKIFLGGPVLFRQERPGLDGKLFTCLKFRTMTEARDARGELLPDGERLTGFGKFLRGSSVDELPELLNVIRGEMSLVGPRPLLTQYLGRYTAEQMRRHEIKPGITGWAQINGRNAVEWEKRFELDVWYVDHRSFWLDLVILVRTVGKMLAPEGISSAGHATMPEFFGVGGDSKARGAR